MFANYHTHTFRCHHAAGEDREYIEAAINAGIKVLGMADHCPWIFGNGYVSQIRMSPAETDGYFQSFTDLKNEYAADIKLYIGFEAEYIPELMEAQDRFLADYPVDYMILGQHSVAPEYASPYTGDLTGDTAFLERYTDLVIEGMESGRYRYLAHPDVINFTGSTDEYDRHMTRICEWLKENDSPVEINLLGLAGDFELGVAIGDADVEGLLNAFDVLIEGTEHADDLFHALGVDDSVHVMLPLRTDRWDRRGR